MRVTVVVAVLMVVCGIFSFALGWAARGMENERVATQRARRRADRLKARADARISATQPRPSQVVQARYAPTSLDRNAFGNLEE